LPGFKPTRYPSFVGFSDTIQTHLLNYRLMANFSGKAELRQRMLAELILLSPKEREAKSLRICEQLQGILADAVVSLFAPARNEPDIDLLWQSRSSSSRNWLYPRCEASNLVFCHVESIAELAPGRFGIREPKGPIFPDPPSIVLVPGLAFDFQGRRLGRGAGYYDRFLAMLPPTTRKIGVCFSFQVLTDIPIEQHDQRVDTIVHA
jgi:5-formyltetrahydrofolate cyclo-ligase